MDNEVGGRSWTITADGKSIDKLQWEEMIGQLVTLTHWDITRPRFPMDEEIPF